jgi:hypothetical protein
MTWKPINLRGLSFLGPGKVVAKVDFNSGLNVVAGASDTGKSFMVEAIDFMLGAKTLSEIKAREGYDLVRLGFEEAGNDRAEERVSTLQRSVDGGNVAVAQGLILSGSWPEEFKVLRTDSSGETLSQFLLAKIGLQEKVLQRNKKGETQRLSFRNLSKLVLIKEGDIIKQMSPIFTGQHLTPTPEYSLFKLLLTGVDASSLIPHAAAITREPADDATTKRIRSNLLSEFIGDLQAEIQRSSITNVRDAEVRLAELRAATDSMKESLDSLQRAMSGHLRERSGLSEEILGRATRHDEIQSLLARFALLMDHYRIDLNRLASIEESGSLFVKLDRVRCPLCGAVPEHQHAGEPSDSDLDSIVESAGSERAKIELLAMELDRTISDLEQERDELAGELVNLNSKLTELDLDVQIANSPFSEASANFASATEE